MLSKLKTGLTKTRLSFVENIARAVKSTTKIDGEFLAELEEILILGDVGTKTASALIERLRQKSREKPPSKEELVNMLKQEMITLLQVSDSGAQHQELHAGQVKPLVISMVGVNGTGKTTTIGKLAHRYRKEGNSVLIAAADTFRAAAGEQLEVWAARAHAEIVRNQPGADPAAVAFDALNAAKSRKVDVLIIDTAGRLHTKVNLMAELQKIHRVLDKAMPDAPQQVLLVMDATTGQNGLSQAQQFTRAVGVTGIVVAKLDGTAKGGVVFSIAHDLKIPVRYVGVGEGIDDLEAFDPQTFVEALFQ